MKICPGAVVTPSPYFIDTFRYFFKRFYSQEKLTQWFLRKAGEETLPFDFPDMLKMHPRTIVFLPRELEHSVKFMKSMPDGWFKNILFCTHESRHSVISARRTHAVYYSDKECRYGEPVFSEIQKKLRDFNPQVCIYLDEPFLPRLYLAKTCNAACRIGFANENLYPFLNLSLHRGNKSEAETISEYYGVC